MTSSNEPASAFTHDRQDDAPVVTPVYVRRPKKSDKSRNLLLAGTALLLAASAVVLLATPRSGQPARQTAQAQPTPAPVAAPVAAIDPTPALAEPMTPTAPEPAAAPSVPVQRARARVTPSTRAASQPGPIMQARAATDEVQDASAAVPAPTPPTVSIPAAQATPPVVDLPVSPQ